MGVDFFRRARRATPRSIGAGPAAPPHDPDQRHAAHRRVVRVPRARSEFLVGISIDGPERDARRVPRRQAGAPHVRRGPGRARPARRRRRRLERALHGARREPGRAARGVPPLPRRARRRFIQFIPIVERVDETGRTRRSPTARSTPARGARSSPTVFDEWVRRDVGTVFVQMFDAALASWYGTAAGAVHLRRDVRQRRRARAQRRPLLVRPLRGSRAPARQHHARRTWSSCSRRRRSVRSATPSATRCRASAGSARCCFACRGECPKNRVAVTADGELGLNHLCAGYLHFFTHVDGLMRVMADALRRGGFADEVMQVLAARRSQRPVPVRQRPQDQALPRRLTGRGRGSRGRRGLGTWNAPSMVVSRSSTSARVRVGIVGLGDVDARLRQRAHQQLRERAQRLAPDDAGVHRRAAARRGVRPRAKRFSIARASSQPSTARASCMRMRCTAGSRCASIQRLQPTPEREPRVRVEELRTGAVRRVLLHALDDGPEQGLLAGEVVVAARPW